MEKWQFIEEIWAKIAVGTPIYRWNSNLAVGSQSGTNLAVGSHYYRWNRIWAIGSTRGTSKPSDRAGERSEKSAKNRRFIAEISPIYRRFPAATGDLMKKSPIYRDSAIYRRFIADLLAIFGEISSFDFSPPYAVSPPSDTRYIGDISPIFRDFFLHGYNPWFHSSYYWNRCTPSCI